MRRLAVLATLAATIGFVATIHHSSAQACRCAGIESWNLTFVDASPGVDREFWKRWLYYSDFGDAYGIKGVHVYLDLAAVP